MAGKQSTELYFDGIHPKTIVLLIGADAVLEQMWCSIPLSARRTVKRWVTRALKVCSPSLLGDLLAMFPPLQACLHPETTIKARRYLGEFTVMVRTLYPIEREMLSGIYDPVTTGIIRRYVKPGDVCADIGANVGALSLAMAQQAGPTGTVYAFEPGPMLYERLQTNIRLNHVRCIVPIQQGLSDRRGVLHWAEDMNNRGNADLLGTSGIPVSVLTLDEFCQERGVTRLDFIKVDVEGMELEVLKGASSVLSTIRPVLYFETHPGFLTSLGPDAFWKIERLLKEAQYPLYKVSRDGSLIMPTTADDLSLNTLALPEPGQNYNSR
jgi:FkbM family methyltransferase